LNVSSEIEASPRLTRRRMIEPRKLISSIDPLSRFAPGLPSPSATPSGRMAPETVSPGRASGRGFAAISG